MLDFGNARFCLLFNAALKPIFQLYDRSLGMIKDFGTVFLPRGDKLRAFVYLWITGYFSIYKLGNVDNDYTERRTKHFTVQLWRQHNCYSILESAVRVNNFLFSSVHISMFQNHRLLPWQERTLWITMFGNYGVCRNPICCRQVDQDLSTKPRYLIIQHMKTTFPTPTFRMR